MRFGGVPTSRTSQDIARHRRHRGAQRSVVGAVRCTSIPRLPNPVGAFLGRGETGRANAGSRLCIFIRLLSPAWLVVRGRSAVSLGTRLWFLPPPSFQRIRVKCVLLLKTNRCFVYIELLEFRFCRLNSCQSWYFTGKYSCNRMTQRCLGGAVSKLLRVLNQFVSSRLLWHQA